jgi:hypothetical protein
MTTPTMTAQALPVGGLTLPEAITVARARGFDAVETLGGPIPLDQWNPYAGAWERFDLRFRFVQHPTSGPVLWEVAPNVNGLHVGVWRLLRAC